MADEETNARIRAGRAASPRFGTAPARAASYDLRAGAGDSGFYNAAFFGKSSAVDHVRHLHAPELPSGAYRCMSSTQQTTSTLQIVWLVCAIDLSTA
jgi:hypothetical protein